MNEPQIGNGLADIKVETNTIPAAVEQKSPEIASEPTPKLATTEPNTPLEEVIEPVELKQDIKLEPTAADNANETARKAIGDKLRADEAERRLRELQPKVEVPEKQPDINDQTTWGPKYKDAPNDLENFLKAHAEWAREDGRRAERTDASRAEQQRQALATKTEVMKKEQDSRAKHSDYDSIITPILPVIANIPLLKDFIAKNPMGTEVMYELGRNPVVLQQMMQSDAWTVGEQLLNMAARLKKPVAVQITNAPEPIKPLGSRETVKPNLAELAGKDTNGYIKTMNKRELAKKRA